MPSPAMQRLLWALFTACLCAPGVEAFSWGIDRRFRAPAQHQQSHVSSTEPRLPNTYALALNELQELESEPLCHRIAARLLVRNCQLLDGQDEATVHTDSGRAARDFVDFYAASLAICDLERGSFAIPQSCSSFRESALATISIPAKPQLHVSTQEIDGCLEGLARSDSAWNTWVSYRHKALRFCEAARAENEKDRTIHLHQRLTDILEKLTTNVEAELESRMNLVNHAFRDASHSLENLAPQVDSLKSKLDVLGGFMGEKLLKTAQESSTALHNGLEDAKTLRQMLLVLLKATIESSAELATSHEMALQAATAQFDDEIGTMLAAFAAAVASTTSLQDQMEVSNSKAVEIVEKQKIMQMGMERLQELADGLAVQYDKHEGRLEQAQEKAEEILGTLDMASTSAAGFRNTLSNGLGLTGWWPYVVFPAASLVMGSYGLEPSLARNLWLLGLGEVAGFVVSSASHYASLILPTLKASAQLDKRLNTTFDIDNLPYESIGPRELGNSQRDRLGQH